MKYLFGASVFVSSAIVHPYWGMAMVCGVVSYKCFTWNGEQEGSVK